MFLILLTCRAVSSQISSHILNQRCVIICFKKEERYQVKNGKELYRLRSSVPNKREGVVRLIPPRPFIILEKLFTKGGQVFLNG